MSTPLLVILATLAAGIVQAVPGAAQLLQLEREALGRGELWRLLGGHFAHYSFEHFLLDAVMFLVLGLACEARSPSRTRWALALASLSIPAAVLLLSPEMQCYRGLSGLDSALFALLVALNFRAGEARSRMCLLAGALFLAKVLFELGTGRSVFLDSNALGFMPVPLAHAVGALCGGLAGLVGPGRAGYRRTSRAPRRDGQLAAGS